MVLGPSSSRLMEASSLFVEQVQMREEENKGAVLYGFSQKPQLSSETNWSASSFLIVTSYSRKGFYLWLNKGSRIRMRWEAQASSLSQLQMVIIKGDRKYETVIPKSASSPVAVRLDEPLTGKEAEFVAEEDDKYYIGMINTNPRSIMMRMSVNATSKTYDITRASHVCSTLNGSCQLKLLFPKTQYVVLTTPNNGDLGGWHIELAFIARLVTYIAILGFIIVAIFVILKYLGACDGETTAMDAPVSAISETDPIMPAEKPFPFRYGTNEEGEESSSSNSSSEDLYDAKLCAICYDEQRNCFFVPCGHCATCYDCAQRIMEGESRMCPICRRVIHKARRLFSP
ncbi:hypothetical protein HS088_TW14G00212 [Tripterygium wilfordii]|uniref:RING-type domain-containing protein n=2 Tax=Tripterygium wilfordii TaxID=458696 RepID=A0A7J7CPZ8_TRIWF|nr:E3 ubiquitin-protein ligase APD2-like isoform X2 [Tripterygium wilfordii]KAF5736078.1 hypothetical protein HS088_TW14G00212 [Tripterygium wilfordii]